MDWTHLHEQYAGKWVALKDDEETVVGSGDSAQAAMQEAKEAGEESPVLTRVPEEVVAHVG